MGAGASVRAPLMVIHEDGAKLLEEYEFIEKLVQSGEATWDNLSEDQVETMKAVLSILKDKAFFDKKKDGKEARGGDEDAMYHLAVLLTEGRGVEKNENNDLEAVFFLKEGASRGHFLCKFLLGEMFYDNRGVAKTNGKYFNQFRGVKLWTEVVEKHVHVPAYLRLAEAWKTGVGVMKIDQAKAFEYYAKATNAHVAGAYSELAEMYEKGSGGMKKDEAKAAQQYQFSVEQGDDKAKYHLGNMYLDGRGVAKDKEKGQQLFNEAVSKGYSNALYHQAILFSRTAKGTDVFKAIGMLNRAARQGHPKAKLQLERIKSGEQIHDDEVKELNTKKDNRRGAFKLKMAMGRVKEGEGRDQAASPPPEAKAAGSPAAKFDWEGKPLDKKQKKKTAEPWSPFSPLSPTIASMKKSAASAVKGVVAVSKTAGLLRKAAANAAKQKLLGKPKPTETQLTEPISPVMIMRFRNALDDGRELWEVAHGL